MHLTKMLTDGAVLSVVASAWLLMVLAINPRLMVQDYPAELQAMVPPKTVEERRSALFLGIPLLLLLFGLPLWSAVSLKHASASAIGFWTLVLHAGGVASVFNLVDLLVLDWLLFCFVTPRFMVLPGTEGAAGYKNYAFHFRGFLIGTALSAITGLVLGGIAYVF